MGTPRFTLRHGTPRDFPEIRGFFHTDNNQYNAARGDQVMLDAIQNRDVFLVERDGTNEIVGASALFHYLDGDYAEAGASRITGPIGGFSVHMIMHYIRASHLCLNNSSLSAYFGIVANDNEPSKKNIKQAGFELWSTPDPAMLEERSRLLGRKLDLSDKSLYKLPSARFVDHACKLLEVARRDGWDPEINSLAIPVVSLSRPSRDAEAMESIDLSLKIEPLIYYWQDLIRLCNQDADLYRSL